MNGRKREGANDRPLEWGVKEDIKRILDSLPYCFYFMPAAGTFGKAGIADFIGLCNGRFFAIEAKRDEHETPRFNQRIFLAAVRRARGFARTYHSGNVGKLRAALAQHCGVE